MKINVYSDVVPYAATSWVAEQVVLGLLQSGHEVAVVPLEQDYKVATPHPAVLLALGEPFSGNVLKIVVRPLVRLMAGLVKDAVVVTIWETDAISPQQVDMLNLARAVVVPTKWLRDVFKRCGVKAPMRVVNYGVDSVFEPTLGTFPKQTVFLTAGRTAHGRTRKGVDLVISAFLLAFPDEKDVVLQVKTHDDCVLPEIVSSRIQVIRGWWPKKTMADWYRQGLAFVSGATAEGWGLHQNEAMACGKPVIGVAFGAITTFFKPPSNGYSVDFRHVKVDGLPGWWAQPSVESMAAVMRVVYEAPVNAFLCGLQAAHDVERFTLGAMQQQHAKVLLSYA